MEIHHVAPHFHPEKGGVESSVLGLGRQLVRRGHTVIVHTSAVGVHGEPLPRLGEVDGIKVRRYRPSVRLGYYSTLFRPDIRAADVVHLHGYGFFTNDRVAHTMQDATPIVYSLHHGVAQPPPSWRAGAKWRLYHALRGRATLERSASIIASSPPDREWLTARGFPADRIHVLPTGVEPTAFEPGSPERARFRFRLHEYILFLGRLHREKSPDHVLRALAGLQGWQGSIVFAGPDGGMRSRLESLAESLEFRGRCVFAGEVDEATKRDLFSGASSLVVPSFYEAQGIAVLEAWAQGIPVVASRVGGLPFTIDEAVDGLLYDWGDLTGLREALRRVLSNPETAAAMGRAGMEKARSRFSWDLLASRFEAVYEQARSL